MADFVNDYSNLAGAGAAFNSFATAYNDAQDRQVKKQEAQAKLAAMNAQMDRDATDQAIKLKTSDLRKTSTGALEDIAPSLKEQNAQSLAAQEKGMNAPEIDETTGKLKPITWNPQSAPMTAARAKETNSLKPPSTTADKNRDSREKSQAQRQWNSEFSEKGPITMRAEGANRIMKLMDDGEAGKFKTTKAFLGQLNGEIARLELGAQSPALGAQEKTDMNSSAADLHALADKFFNNVSDVDLKKQIQQARGMVTGLRDSYLDAADRKADELMAGATEAQAGVFDAKRKSFQSHFKRSEPVQESPQQQTPAQGLVRPGLVGAQGLVGGSPPQQQAAPPTTDHAIGTKQIFKGVTYTFKGGDWNDKKNWAPASGGG